MHCDAIVPVQKEKRGSPFFLLYVVFWGCQEKEGSKLEV